MFVRLHLATYPRHSSGASYGHLGPIVGIKVNAPAKWGSKARTDHHTTSLAVAVDSQRSFFKVQEQPNHISNCGGLAARPVLFFMKAKFHSIVSILPQTSSAC